MSSSTRPRFALTLLGWAHGLSGGDRHLLQMARFWKDHADVTVIGPRAAAPVVDQFAGDVALVPVGWVGPIFRRFPPTLAAEYLRRAVVAMRLDVRSPDVVVAGSHFLADAAALARFARRGTLGVVYVYHLVATRRGLDPRSLWSRADERVSLALLRGNADVVFTSNDETAKSLAARGFAPVHTAVGIDQSRLRGSTAGPRTRQCLFAARMTRPKGVADAVSAWAIVTRRFPDARLVMLGEGPEREGGILLSRKLGIERSIDWPGFVPEEEKVRLFRESQLFLAPSYEEGWGIAVCEALASGVPVVAYRLPALEELFSGAYCAVDVGDVNALAAQVLALFGDEALSTELAINGREVAARYDVERVAETELEVILQRLHRRRC